MLVVTLPASRRARFLKARYGENADTMAHEMCLRMIGRNNIDAAELWSQVLTRLHDD